MSWKEKLNLNAAIENDEVVEYLKNLGFKENKMNPIYFNEEAMIREIKKPGAPCLHLAMKKDETSDVYSIYINDDEAYVERISYTFEDSNYILLEERLTMENVDKVLDKLIL